MDYSSRDVRYASTYAENETALGWLRKEEPEDVIEPELPIVDAHHHLWDNRRGSCKYRTIVYGLPELLEDLYDGHNIVATVYCQSSCWGRSAGPVEFRSVGEVEFCQGMAAACDSGLYSPAGRMSAKACCGIQGMVDLCHANVEDVMKEMIRCRNFRGFRVRALPDLVFDEAFKRGLRLAQSHGLVIDWWNEPSPAYKPQALPKLAEIAREFPGITFVLNHLGGLVGPAMGGDEVEATWRKELEEIAKNLNVVCKVGGIFMPKNGFDLHMRDRPPGSEELADLVFPYFSHAIQCFGTERCMFESNFPVDKDSASYRTLWNMFKRVAAKAGLTEAQKADIFKDTAVRVYDLDLGTGGSGRKRKFDHAS